jgi:uncharacterized membrane protein YciS (DUF1049 family)
MIVLGIILVVVAGALIAAAVINGSDPAVLDFSAFKVHTTEAAVFGVGAATVFALVIGTWFLQKGLASRRRRRREVKELRKQVVIRDRQAAELKARQANEAEHREGDDSDTAPDSTSRE